MVHPGGRPSKIKKFMEVAEEVLFADINAVIFTDHDLIELINTKLDKKERIGVSTFKAWKQQAKEDDVKNPLLKQFLALYKKALILQEKYLFEKLREDEKAWQKWAWIIERKFDDWNLRKKVDHTSKGERITGFNYIVPNGNNDKADSEAA